MKRAVLRRKSERCVGIQIQTPTGRRPDSTREIEPDHPVDEARAHAAAGEGPGQRELLARTRASHAGEEHDARSGPTVRKLEPRAPKRVAARRVAAIAAQGSRPAEVPVALDWNASVRDAASQLDPPREVRTERRRDAQRATHTPKPIRPGATVERHIGGPLRPPGIDPALRAKREGHAGRVGGAGADVWTEDVGGVHGGWRGAVGGR